MADDKQYGEIICEIEKDTEADDDRTTRFIGTTAVRDRDGDEIPLKGWDFKAFKKNSPFLWGHNRDYGLGPRVVLGHVTKISKEKANGVEGWVFSVRWLKEGTNELADMAREMVEQGALKAVSVGFRPIKSRWIQDEEGEQERGAGDNHVRSGREFLKKELLELSLVPVPCNPEALLVAREKGMALPKLVNDYLDQWEKAALQDAYKGEEKPDEKKETEETAKGGKGSADMTDRSQSLQTEREAWLANITAQVANNPLPTYPTQTGSTSIPSSLSNVRWYTTEDTEEIKTLKERVAELERRLTPAALPDSGVAETEPDEGGPKPSPAPAQSKESETAEKQEEAVAKEKAPKVRYRITRRV